MSFNATFRVDNNLELTLKLDDVANVFVENPAFFIEVLRDLSYYPFAFEEGIQDDDHEDTIKFLETLIQHLKS